MMNQNEIVHAPTTGASNVAYILMYYVDPWLKDLKLLYII